VVVGVMMVQDQGVVEGAPCLASSLASYWMKMQSRIDWDIAQKEVAWAASLHLEKHQAFLVYSKLKAY